MAEITKPDYMTWRIATFGTPYIVWHEGLNVGAVTSLTGEDRARAVRMLTFGVRGGDGDAAKAIAAMGETAALPDLHAALQTAVGDNRIGIAQAINRLSGCEEVAGMARQLIAVLEAQNQHWSTRMEAAVGLRDYEDEESETALLAAIERDEAFLVRLHSSDSLLVRWKVEKNNIHLHRDIIDLLRNVRTDDAIQERGERGREAIGMLNQLRKPPAPETDKA
jgi:hypothetical protein